MTPEETLAAVEKADRNLQPQPTVAETVVAYWKRRNAENFTAVCRAIEEAPEGATVKFNFLLPHEDGKGHDYLHMEVFKTAEKAAYFKVSQGHTLALGDDLQRKLDKLFTLFLE